MLIFINFLWPRKLERTLWARCHDILLLGCLENIPKLLPGQGDSEIKVSWSDPGFKPEQPAWSSPTCYKPETIVEVKRP